MESLHQWGTVITTVVSQLQINTVSFCCGCTTADFVLPLCRYLCFISQETKIQPSETYMEQFSAFSHSHYAAQSGSTSEWWIDARKVVRGKCVHWCELILKCCKKKKILATTKKQLDFTFRLWQIEFNLGLINLSHSGQGGAVCVFKLAETQKQRRASELLYKTSLIVNNTSAETVYINS